jgi:hypothetical protein
MDDDGFKEVFQILFLVVCVCLGTSLGVMISDPDAVVVTSDDPIKIFSHPGAVAGALLGLSFFLRAIFLRAALNPETPNKKVHASLSKDSGVRFLLLVAFPLTIYFGVGTALYMLVERLQRIVERLAHSSSASGMSRYCPMPLHGKSMWFTVFFPLIVPGFIVVDALVLLPYCLLWLIYRSINELWQQVVDSLRPD